MKRIIVAFCLLCIVSLGSVSDPTELQPLALPADKILRISAKQVEFEHHGVLPISAELEVVQRFEGETYPIPLDAVKVGFEEVVATVYAGEIVRFDVYDPLYIRTMRVAISTDQFQTIEHQELVFTPTSQLYVEEKGTGRGFVVQAGQEAVVYAKDGRLHVTDGQGTDWEFDQRLYVWSDPQGRIGINSFRRGTGTLFYPQYRGRFELTLLAGGERFLAINEVNLEDYLLQVVPSEMPISWPIEALKAQAVAARTYAVAQALYSRQGHLGFHVADSTSSQVYNNQMEAESTTKAILATEGEILATAQGTINSTYFYSTSSRGAIIDWDSWSDASEHALEGYSPWYRWTCTLGRSELIRLLRPHVLGELVALEVLERDGLGRVVSLAVIGTEGKSIIDGELNIRRSLAPSGLQGVSGALPGQSLLPSALFFLENQHDTLGELTSVTIYGGGSGHNLGMSQWGAKGMAEAGSDYLAILSEYYSEAHLITHSEQLRY